MFNREKILFEGDTKLDHYQVIDMVYEGRKARVLFNGNKTAAFSGMPLDGGNALLFDYIQRFFELVSHIRPRKLLMIGGGVYTLPMALIHALPDINIDVVEIDAGLEPIAKRFFGLTAHERLRIIHADGKDFLSNYNGEYDMIIVDAFTQLRIPKSLTGMDTTRLINKHLSSKGIVAINIISSYKGRNCLPLEKIYNDYSSIFKGSGVYPAEPGESPWQPQNFILISHKGEKPQSYGLRFRALDPPF